MANPFYHIRVSLVYCFILSHINSLKSIGFNGDRPNRRNLQVILPNFTGRSDSCPNRLNQSKDFATTETHHIKIIKTLLFVLLHHKFIRCGSNNCNLFHGLLQEILNLFRWERSSIYHYMADHFRFQNMSQFVNS